MSSGGYKQESLPFDILRGYNDTISNFTCQGNIVIDNDVIFRIDCSDPVSIADWTTLIILLDSNLFLK